MGRPQLNNCSYFPHDADMRNHRKVKAIRNKFSNGYAIWVMLLEYLTGIDGNEFELSDVEFELMSGDFGFSVTEIRDVVNYCISLDMLFNKNGFIHSESLDERLAPVYEKRNRAKELSKKQQRRNGKYVTEIPESNGETVTEKPQSKVDKIRIDKSKTEKSKSKENNIGETSSPLHNRFREIFLEKYLRKKGSEFSWFEKTQVGKHGKNLNGIIGQVQTKVKSKISEPGDQDYLDLWEIMLEHLPDWEFKNTFSPAGINSRFNEIFDKINNHKNGINFANIDRQTADYQEAFGTNPYGKKG